MSISSRTVLTEEKTVHVENYKQLTADLGVISYTENHKRYDDVYNIPNAETQDLLGRVQAGVKVMATIAPDDSGDEDGHPQVKSAVIKQD